jgi:hypothetical protein
MDSMVSSDGWLRNAILGRTCVSPLEIKAETNGTTNVKLHQLVKDMHGDVLLDQVVGHTFTIADGLIERMCISEDKPAFGR